MFYYMNRFKIQVYNIGIVNSSVLDTGIQAGSIRWLNHSYRDRFFADPFLWYQDSIFYYILSEELCFYEEYGKIVLLKVTKENFSLHSKEVIIAEPYHLSFPYCEENSEFVTPEAVESGVCKRYRISKTTHQVMDMKIIAHEGIIDPIFKGSWLFGGNKEKPSGALYAYRKDKKKEYYQLLPQDSRLISNGKTHSRNAGRIFEYRNQWIRPAQECTQRYGHMTVLMEILRWPDDGYEEREYMRVDSHDNPPYDQTLHTFNVYDGFILIDGSRDTLEFRNIAYKARKYLRRLCRKK